MGGSNPVSDPLTQCQDLCVLLAATDEALRALLPTLRDEEQSLAALEPDLAAESAAAGGDAGRLDEGLADDGDRAVQAVQALGDAAMDLADRVSEVEAGAQAAEAALDRDLDAKADALESGLDALGSEGFGRLEHELEEVRSDFAHALDVLELDLEALEGAFGQTEDALARDHGLTEDTFEATRRAVEDVVHELGGTSVDRHEVAGFLEFTVADALQERLEDAREGMTSGLTDWEGTLDAQAAALHGSIESLVESAAQAVWGEARRLEERVEALAGPQETLRIEIAQSEADLAAAQPALEGAGALASRIETTEGHIRWIRDVAAAMDSQ